MSNGNGSSGGNHSRPNNQMNDPYTKRDSYATRDAYATKDAYARRDAYKVDDPHENLNREGRDEKQVPCSFWFTSKMKMQDIYSSDSGAQAEGRVFNTDTDVFVLSFIARISMISFANFFLVPTIITALFIGSIYANPELRLIVIIVEFLYIAYILYCPAWQTFTSGQYAITSTGEDFYSKWRKGYLGYESTTISAFVMSVLVIGLLAEYHMVFDLIHGYFGFSVPPESQFREAVYYVVIPSAVFLILYFILVRKLRTADDKKRRTNKRINIDMRTKSIIGQLNMMMDSPDL